MFSGIPASANLAREGHSNDVDDLHFDAGASPRIPYIPSLMVKLLGRETSSWRNLCGRDVGRFESTYT